MRKFQKVSWHLKDGTPGHGTVVSNEENGHVLVAVETEGEEKHVIWCTITWLTPIEESTPEPASETPPSDTPPV